MTACLANARISSPTKARRGMLAGAILSVAIYALGCGGQSQTESRDALPTEEPTLKTPALVRTPAPQLGGVEPSAACLSAMQAAARASSAQADVIDIPHRVRMLVR